MKIFLNTLLFCFFNLLVITKTYSQSIHYFGLDTSYNHDPKDILLTSDNGFMINGDCNLAGPFIESFYSKQYYVKTNILGDTLWTKYFNQDSYGGAFSMQSTNGNLHSYGSVGAGYDCNGVGLSYPFSDFSLRTISSSGSLISNYSSNSNCYDRVVDGKKKTVGMHLLVEMKGTAINSSTFKILDFQDNFFALTSQLPLPYNNLTNIEKAPSGYWLVNNTKLYKVTDNSVEMWNSNLSGMMPISDFCRVDYDNLLFARSSNDGAYGDSVRLVKTDSSGVIIWNKKFFLRASNVFQHSSGNYVITGKNNNRTSVLVVNAMGDSLWGKNYTLAMNSNGIKTIEYNNGNIATLAKSGGFGQVGKFALILDTIDNLTNSSLFENEQKTQFSVYPNPTTSTLSISGINSDFSYKISDLQGKLLKQGASDKQIEIETLPAGTYVIGISTDSEVKQLRFVKL